MKTGNYNFRWYEKEDARKVLRVSVGKDGNRSLDTPLSNDESDDFCLYDVIDVSSSGGIDVIESRLMEEQFVDSLSPEEKKLLEMLRSGFQVSEIAMQLGMDEEKVQSVGEAIGRKRIAFYRAEA